MRVSRTAFNLFVYCATGIVLLGLMRPARAIAYVETYAYYYSDLKTHGVTHSGASDASGDFSLGSNYMSGSANSATGTLVTYADGSHFGTSSNPSTAYTHSVISDNLTFSASSTLNISFNMRGTLTPPNSSAYAATGLLISVQGPVHQQIYKIDFFNYSCFGRANCTVANNFNDNYSASFEVDPGSTSVLFNLATPVDAGMGDVKVMVLDFRAEQGVSYTSSSGLFLNDLQAAAIPEPTGGALLLAGLGAIGFVLRRGSLKRNLGHDRLRAT